MMKFSPHITIYNLEVEFDALTEVIWTFSKNLCGLSNQRQRFNIHIVSNVDEEEHGKYLGGSIKSVWRFLDQSIIKTNTVQKNKILLLDFIKNSFLQVADDLKWDKTAIEFAYAKSLDEGIEFNYLTRQLSNKSKTSKASIKLKLVGKKVQIYVVFTTQKRSERDEVLLIETCPFHIDVFRTFRNPKWLTEDEFGFSFLNNMSLTASRKNLLVNWKHNGSEDEIGFIRSLSYQTFESKEAEIKWINK